MLQVTHWSPDTCRCIIGYQWDDSISEDLRVHTPVEYKLCKSHQSLDVNSIEAKVVIELSTFGPIEENTRKNKVLAELEKAGHNSQAVTWAFDDNRDLLLMVTTQGFNKVQEQSKLRNLFGNKIRIL